MEYLDALSTQKAHEVCGVPSAQKYPWKPFINKMTERFLKFENGLETVKRIFYNRISDRILKSEKSSQFVWNNK